MKSSRLCVSIILLLAAGITAPGCSDDDDDDGVAAAVPEATAGMIVDLGRLRPGGRIVINDRVAFTDSVDDNEFDQFLLTVSQDTLVRATLIHDFTNDLDLSFLDANQGVFLTEECDRTTSPEICQLQVAANESVTLEVEAFQGGGEYTLIIE